MKKIITSLLVLCTLVLLAACGAATPTEPTPAAQPESSAAENSSTPEEPAPLPIYAEQLEPGSYEISVDSSSSMFRVVHCQLLVQDGTMQAVMTMSGQGYGMVYMGTGQQALEDSEEAYIPFVLDDQGAKTFTVPVAALDAEVDCAAWSIRKEKWYDRTLVFQSDALPEAAYVTE